MNKTTRLKKPQIPELEDLYTFDELGGRPKYGGVEMTSETDIPSFQEIMDETHSAVVAEATARDDADEELQAQIDAEVAARTAAESQLSADLAAETSARQTADTALAGDIATEASARAAKDTDLQSQVDAIVASSDVKDIVGTKAELDNYDTSTLGDQDIIKVLQDESQSNATTYYRWDASTSAFSLIGSEGPYYTKAQADTLLDTKADKVTTYTKTEVDTALNAKADKATTYTKTEVDTALNAKADKATTYTKTEVNNITGSLTDLTTTDKTNLVAAINELAGVGGKVVYVLAPPDGPDNNYELLEISGGQFVSADMNELNSDILAGKSITLVSVDNLDPGDMGYTAILQNAIVPTGSPTEITFCDTYNNKNWNFDYNGKWLGKTPVAETPTVVQAPGTSQTDVMSQNAVTSMVFADPLARTKVRIGSGASVNDAGQTAIGVSASVGGTEGVALGKQASAAASNSVAIGAYSWATTKGQFEIGTTTSNSGYNNSRYRLLTGLYDPQSDHDAATKGYVDTAVASAGASEINSTDWSNLWQ